MKTSTRWKAFEKATGETPLAYVTRWANDTKLREANEIILAMIAESQVSDAG